MGGHANVSLPKRTLLILASIILVASCKSTADQASLATSDAPTSSPQGVDEWAARSIYLRTIGETGTPAGVVSELGIVAVEFEVGSAATSSGRFVCFMTDQGWSTCTALDANETAGELAALPVSVPRNSWVEAFLVDAPTYQNLGDPTKRASLGRIESPFDEVNTASDDLENYGRDTLKLLGLDELESAGNARFVSK